MNSTVKVLAVLSVGFAGGWAARSLADSPHDAGVKLVALVMSTQKRIAKWAAVERERIEDLFAEAQAEVESTIPTPPKRKAKASTGLGHTVRGEA